MFVFSFDCFSTWIMIHCSKDLGSEQFSFSYNFPIDQNLFLFIFEWEISKRVCIAIVLIGLWYFTGYIICDMNSYLIQYSIDSYRGFIDSILCVTLDNDQLQCLMTKNPLFSENGWKFVYIKKIIIFIKNSRNNYSKIKHVLDHYTVNNFLK